MSPKLPNTRATPQDQAGEGGKRGAVHLVLTSVLVGRVAVTPPGIAHAGALAGTVGATVIVDMRANVVCDSSGLSALIQAHKRADVAGGELRLVMHPAHVPKVFKATGMDRIVKIFSTLPEAVAPVRH
jgi:ABC-type transporter Mla MlaB component